MTTSGPALSSAKYPGISEHTRALHLGGENLQFYHLKREPQTIPCRRSCLPFLLLACYNNISTIPSSCESTRLTAILLRVSKTGAFPHTSTKLPRVLIL